MAERQASAKELERARRKALEIAEAGCLNALASEGESRCELAVEYARKLEDTDAVKRNLIRRCDIKFEESSDPDQIVERAKCTGALILGLTEQEMGQAHKELSKQKPVLRDGTYYLGQVALEAYLTSGSYKIEAPPAEVKLHNVVSSVWSFCVSETGTVNNALHKYSLPEALPLWEKKIAATMASWRFEPILVNNKATTVCTVLTFSSFAP